MHLADGYKSKSQIARVTTEAWVLQNVSCPNCDLPLNEYPANQKSKDVFCNLCDSEFQIKSSKKRFSEKITGAEYNTTLNSVRNGNHPSLMLLFYDENSMRVVDFEIIHYSFLKENCIIPRKPLSPSAKRRGWQGCLISICDVPKIARIFIVKDGSINNTEKAIEKWKASNTATRYSIESRGWLSDVLSIIDKQSSTFDLDDLYAYENHFIKLHPSNNNIQAKIRQQLQIIRDMGMLEFIERGKYRKIGVLLNG